jgi:hypothetical protein
VPEVHTPHDAWVITETASQCGEHPIELDFTEEDIVKVLVLESRSHDSWDSESSTTYVLKDGRIVVASESSDSSGHG